MLKEVCIMKKLTLLSLLIPFLCLIANFSVPAHAVDRTPGEVVQGATDPYSVTLYEEQNYKNHSVHGSLHQVCAC